MQISLYKQKLRRREKKVLETKKLGQFSETEIILGFIKTEKSDSQVKIISKIKTPVLDSKGNKVKDSYTASFKSGKSLDKERVKTTIKEKEVNKLTFKVLKGSNKNDVKVAIKNLYGVDVEKVNIVKTPYKNRQRRGLVRKSYVKAIVTLKEGQKIPSLDTLV